MDFQAMLEEERRKARLERQGLGGKTEEDEEEANEPPPQPPQSRPDELRLALAPKQFSLEDTATGFDGAHYGPEWLTEAEEAELLACVDACGDRWVTLSSRRLQSWGGDPTPEGFTRGEPLPPFLAALSARLVEAGLFSPDEAPNHVLVNDYQPGQGILPHQDGPFYCPKVAIVSLCGSCVMTFSPYVRTEEIGEADADPVASLVLRRRSLLFFTGAAYAEHLHGISATSGDRVFAHCANCEAAGVSAGNMIVRRRRVSLTVRHVPETSRVSSGTGGGGSGGSGGSGESGESAGSEEGVE